MNELSSFTGKRRKIMSKRGGKKETKNKEHVNKYASKKQGSKKD
jgi:hypothetical protein